MLLKYFVTHNFFRNKIGSVLRCSAQWLCLYIWLYNHMILSSKGVNQIQVLYIRTLRNTQGNLLHGSFSTELLCSNVFSTIFFWKFAEVLRQHLKSLFLKLIPTPPITNFQSFLLTFLSKNAIFTIVHHKENEIVQYSTITMNYVNTKHMLPLWDPIVGMSMV